MSQLDLALEADVSAKHVSFLETGRSHPSREMVLRLAEVLDVPVRQRNTLLRAGGYASFYRESHWDDPQLADIRRSIDGVSQDDQTRRRVKRGIHDNAWDELFEGRREAHKPKSEKTDDFRGRMDAAEDTAAEVVRRARAGDHTRAPSLEGTCKDCPWKHVCRPDVPELERRIGTEEDA